ncbi:MAG: GNAT family N-acetyltransferase [Candidatus Nanoarchaeia archaeon]
MNKIIIKKAQEKDLKLLERYLPAENIPNFHKDKISEQKDGNSVWLIAWKDDIPVGHIQLRFNGIQDKKINNLIKNCAHIESLGVKEEFRKQGIGTKLIQEAEQLTKKKKMNRIGMAVGSEDNPEARKLYETLGYKDAGLEEFIVSWNIVKKGITKKENERCVYLIKRL